MRPGTHRRRRHLATTRRIEIDANLQPMHRTLRAMQAEIAASMLDPQLVELVMMRVSQINGCAPCLVWHSKEHLDAGERVERIVSLDAWRESDCFTDKEQAALAWAEAVTRREHNEVPVAEFENVRIQYSEQEIVALTHAVVAINAVNTFNLAFSAKQLGYAAIDEWKERAAD